MKRKSSPKAKSTKVKKTTSAKKSTPKPITMWGVCVYSGCILGPFEFTLGGGKYSSISVDEQDLDPLKLDNWWFEDNENPTSLFQDQRSAQLYADGARAARLALHEALSSLSGSSDLHNDKEYRVWWTGEDEPE